MKRSIHSFRLVVLAATFLGTNGFLARAASALVLAEPDPAGFVYSYAVAPTTDQAIHQAMLKLDLASHPDWRFGWNATGIQGYSVLAAEPDANGRFRIYGLSTGGLDLASACGGALRAALSNGASAPRIMAFWADVSLSSPIMLSPLNGQTSVPRPTTLTWNAVRFAGSYEVQIEYLPTGGTAQLVERVVVQGLGHTSYQLGPGRNYRWRVQAISDEGSIRGSWSPYSRFATRITR